MKYILVFIGGGLGSALRYFVSKYFNNLEHILPYGTFIVNIVGSLLIGVFIGLSIKNEGFTQNQTLLLATGFCGGFTTFSTFAFENLQFLKNGDYLHFLGYTLGTIIVGLIAVFLGFVVIK